MPARIEIKHRVPDARAEKLASQISSHFCRGKKIDLDIFDVYTVEGELDFETVGELLTNPVTQEYSVKQDSWQPNFYPNFDLAIEVGYLPGVTDNIGDTATEIITDVPGLNGERVFSSQLFLISGELTQKEETEILKSLFNPLIQRATRMIRDEFESSLGMPIYLPIVQLGQNGSVTEVNLDVSDEELIRIGKQGIENEDGTRRGPLALNETYMQTIKDHFESLGRKPTDIELESIAQTWSEHCKHTIFNDPIDDIEEGLFDRYIRAATNQIRKDKGENDICVSVFKDNAGGIIFDDDYLISDKVETHNSPSALDPFGGSITGIVGVNRDALGFGLGAKPVANRYGFCFADPRISQVLYRDADLKEELLSAKRINTGVIAGVNSGGNQSGIPTTQGFTFYDQRYRGKPLVFVGTLGLLPRKIGERLGHEKAARAGDFIVMVGGRVGLDGIHGATFSSEALDDGSPATAVQIGDPITQKKMSDALVKEARQMDLYSSITDNGAGGLSCSVAEMAKECGGCEVHLEKVPLKYPGISPWQIWISESQERMTLSVLPEKWEQLQDLMQSRGVEATVIGQFTESGKCVVKFEGETTMDLDMDFLHNGLPPIPKKSEPLIMSAKQPEITEPTNYNQVLLDMVSRLNIAGFDEISQQYDHDVQGGSVLKPLHGKGRVNADATLVKPRLDSNRGVVLSQALYPSYSEIDCYHMAACAIDTAVRNAVVAGGSLDHLALQDNFCWSSSDDPIRLHQLKVAAKACYDYAVVYGTPFISGKDSMYNDFSGYDEQGDKVRISVPPTLLISSIGVVEDVSKVVSLDAKVPGDLIILLGDTEEELAGSEYSQLRQEENKDYIAGSDVPKVRAEENKRLYQNYYECVQEGLISSAISLGRGGLGTGIVKTLIAGKLGAKIELRNINENKLRDDHLLFSESQGRILITINPKKLFELSDILDRYSIIGEITEDHTLQIHGSSGKKIIDVGINELLTTYKQQLYD